jgi:hypothetical protein
MTLINISKKFDNAKGIVTFQPFHCALDNEILIRR